MCGFAVAVGWPEARATVAKMVEGIRHRGDVTDPIFEPASKVAMVTRRLCIVDRDNAMQPQASFDGKLVVSFNGEIYNYRALRHELEQMGVRFKTESDTEVLANAIRVWGTSALERVSGMFAFVAYEIPTGIFIAARDPFGIKPLYVIQRGAAFLLCSEIKPLLDADETGEVMLLPPGYLLSNRVCTPFQSIIRKQSVSRQASDARELDAVLSEAVLSHIPPDLPFAVLFSGGIDSTLVAHYARQHRPETPGYFVGSETAPDYPFAAAYAEATGFDLRIVPFEPDSTATFARIDEAVEAAESFEPSLVRGALCSLDAARRIHDDGMRIALCGEGADELFCGYGPLEWGFTHGNDVGRPLRAETLGQMHRVSLQRVDRGSMRHQVETRVPFLAPEVAEYALSLDAGALVKNGTGKAPLREIYDLHPATLPRLIRDRSKVLFSEGSGLDVSADGSYWRQRFEAEISDTDLEDGKKFFAGFDVLTKEDLFYLRILHRKMNVFRIPHLKGRVRLDMPAEWHQERATA